MGEAALQLSFPKTSSKNWKGTSSFAFATSYQSQMQTQLTSIAAIVKRLRLLCLRPLKSWNIPLFTEGRVILTKTGTSTSLNTGSTPPKDSPLL